MTKKTWDVGEDVEQLELSYIAVGNAKWCSPFGKPFSVSLNAKYTLTI